MEWVSVSRTGAEFDALLTSALGEVRAALPEGRADLAFVFVGAEHAGAAHTLPSRLRAALGDTHVVGCTAGGVIGGAREYEHAPALSILAGRVPGAVAHGFHLEASDLPDPDAPPGAWQEVVGISHADRPSFVLLADPFTVRTDRLLTGLDFAYSDAVKVGGVASGAQQPGEQVLFHGDRVVRSGVVGLALLGAIDVAPAVTQGCRAIGRPMRISACDGHLLRGLDDRPVLAGLQEVLAGASERDRSLAGHSLFLGFETDPFAGTDEGPWLIRNLLGLDPETQGLYVGETLRPGRRVRFHVRDRVTSHEDLERTLTAAEAPASPAPCGALLFSCLGRGSSLYGTTDHDSNVFFEHFEDVPLGGFFCNGEIGPVGPTTHVHGYTSVFALLREPLAAPES